MAWKLRWPVVRQDDTKAGLTINGNQGTPASVPLGDGFMPIGGPRGTTNFPAVPAAYAAINLVSEQMAILGRSVVDQNQVPLPGHPVSTLLRFPSRMLDPLQFYLITCRTLAAGGNAYCWIRRDFVTKRPIELVPAVCERTEWVDSRATPYQRYTLRLMGADGLSGFVFNRRIVVNANDVLAFHGPGYNGLFSPSPVQFVAANILESMDRVVNRHRALLEEGGTLDKVLLVDAENVSQEQFIKARENLATSYQMAKEKNQIPVLPPGVELKRIQALSASDMQLIEVLKWGVEDVARIWGMSPVRLGHYYEGLRVATFEYQATDFERFTISPKAMVLDSQCTRKLLSTDDVMEGLSVASDTDNVARGSLSDRATVADLLVSRAGVWTPNEGRELTGKQPRADGDRLLQPKGAPTQNPPRNPRRGEDE